MVLNMRPKSLGGVSSLEIRQLEMGDIGVWYIHVYYSLFMH